MDTPICDFVREYVARKGLRLHMPGHKGCGLLGMEQLDITEVAGADSLYEADGIIAKSEANASGLFGCPTYYSTEGSSQCIRAMLYLVLTLARQKGRSPLIAAGRNAHKTFLTAAALLDLQVHWLYPETGANYLSCNLSAQELETYLTTAAEKPMAVYVTCPDYLGNVADIQALAAVCHQNDVLLVVDNAHGAYLKFLPRSQHPIDLGADICCDSAHKTLPALTGGAYLHLSAEMETLLGSQVRNALMIFGSTSPSYLILQSLDAVNRYLETYPVQLADFASKVQALKETLVQHGYTLYGNEPLKITLDAKAYGYQGNRLAEQLRSYNIEPEFADQDFLVLMLSPDNVDLQPLAQALCALPKKPSICEPAPAFVPGQQAMSIRQAMLSANETLPADRCLGRILAVPTVGCPPAVPILVCGETVTPHALSCLSYYGITTCCVVKE